MSCSSIEINKPLRPQIVVSPRSDANSDANSNCCHKSDICPHLKSGVASSEQLVMLQITSSERSLTYSKKNIDQE